MAPLTVHYNGNSETIRRADVRRAFICHAFLPNLTHAEAAPNLCPRCAGDRRFPTA